ATLAVGADVDFVSLATVYVGVQIIRQIPFTPGGIGIIEAALLAGLIAAGSAAAPAAAAVVIYRALTFWLVLPAGGIAALLDRATAATPTSVAPVPDAA
ncbi:MAG: lysylphosphatidylglycerol synthase domain-containing protein, partial [Nakamurella sp.]